VNELIGGRHLFQDPENTRNTLRTAKESAENPRRSAGKWHQDPWRTANPQAVSRLLHPRRL
jgi:hypothetical protein